MPVDRQKTRSSRKLSFRSDAIGSKIALIQQCPSRSPIVAFRIHRRTQIAGLLAVTLTLLLIGAILWMMNA
jgi:hypothetical protein